MTQHTVFNFPATAPLPPSQNTVITPADVRMFAIASENQQDTLAELEASLNEQMQADAEEEEQAEARLEDGDAVDELDALLAEATSEAQDRVLGKSLRQQLSRLSSTSQEHAYLKAKLQEWEARREWDTQANCAMFTKYTCACGSTHTIFNGLFYRQSHREMRTVKRWVAATQFLQGNLTTAALAELPNETILQQHTIPMCGSCAADKGWNIEKASTEWNN